MKLKKVLFSVVSLITLACCQQQKKQDFNIKDIATIKDSIYTKNNISYKGNLINIKEYEVREPRENIIPYFFSSKGNYKTDFEKDSNGVETIEGKYHPTVICRRALTSYHKYKETNDIEAKKIFNNQLNWLENNFSKYKKNYGYWYFPNKSRKVYNLDPYWNSGLTQAFGIGVCFMAYDLYNDKSYLKMATQAFKGYLIPVEKGGLYRELENEYTWFEEYPTSKPSLVLNGFIFSLAGVKNYYDNTGDPLAKKMFDDGVESLKNRLPLYDEEFISKYRLLEDTGQKAKESYHRLHIWQLTWLYIITGDKVFYDYAKKFLEVKRTDFYKQDIKRIKSIEVSEKQNLSKYLIDDNWGWGKIWKSNLPAKLKFNFEGMKKINGFAIYFDDKKSSELPLKVYSDKEIEYKIVRDLLHTSSKNEDTFIKVYKFLDEIKTTDLRLEFSSNKGEVRINESYIFVDMSEEMEKLIQTIKLKIEKHKNFNLN